MRVVDAADGGKKQEKGEKVAYPVSESQPSMPTIYVEEALVRWKEVQDNLFFPFYPLRYICRMLHITAFFFSLSLSLLPWRNVKQLFSIF